MTEKQQELIKFIEEFVSQNGYSPTIKEIQRGLNLRSPSSVQVKLSSLKKQGFVTWNPKSARTLKIL